MKKLGWVVPLLGTILMGLSTWVLITLVELQTLVAMLQQEILGMDKVIGRIYAHMDRLDGEVKFILTLVICNATCGPQFEWPQKFDSFYDCARMGYKAG